MGKWSSMTKGETGMISSRKQPVRTKKRKMSRERKNNKQNYEGFCLCIDSKTK